MEKDSFLVDQMRSLSFKGKAQIVLTSFCIPLLLFITAGTLRYAEESRILAAEVRGTQNLRPLLLEQLHIAGLSADPESIETQSWQLRSIELLRLEQSAYQIGDESGLILDTELHTLYLSLIAAQVMPRLINASAELKAIHAGIANDQGYSFWRSVLLGQLDVLERYTRTVNENLGFTTLATDDFYSVREGLLAAKGLTKSSPISDQDAFGILDKFLKAKIHLITNTQEIALAKRQRDLLSRNLWLAFLVGLSIVACVSCFCVFYEGTVRDIEQQRKVDSELRHAKERAERLSQVKSEFLSNMSHEIRTPMNGVLGMLELARSSSDPREQQHYLATAQSSAGALLKILNEILDYSKLEARQVQLESSAWNLHALLDELKALYSNLCLLKQLEFALHLDPRLPRNVTGDELRTRQILTNLLENAIKFTVHGHVHLNVRQGADSKGLDTLIFEVEDTGIGVPPSQQSSIFNAFEQADSSTTRRFGGTGLGLSISSELARLMGGALTLRSAPDDGSVFRFEIPLRPCAETAKVKTLNSTFKSDSDHAGVSENLQVFSRSLQILVVEDHKVNQILAKTLLTKWGHTVTIAQNGQEALDVFPSKQWDLVLMDLQMPVLGGKDATRLIRQAEIAGRRTPIIALSASALHEDLVECLSAGMDDHLAKPYSSLSLAKIVHKHVS
jgi:signal transduction histidine kinase/ActR/RegA family two-component response regulator